MKKPNKRKKQKISRVSKKEIDFQALANQAKRAKEYLEAMHLASKTLSEEAMLEIDRLT